MPPFHSAFITGASSGLGRGLALHYARAGVTVHAAARRKAELDALVREASSASGKIIPVVLDVLDTEAHVKAIAEAEEASGGALDLVIANAGIAQPTPAKKLQWQRVKQIMDVNVSAACVTVSAALPAMVKRGSGTISAVASLAAFRGLPGNAAYCASKAAVHTFMESLRVDLRGTGVKVTTIYPGFVKTEMTAKNKYPMPFLMELDAAVKVMAKGLDRGQAVVAYPAPMVAAMKGISALPRPVYESMAKRARMF